MRYDEAFLNSFNKAYGDPASQAFEMWKYKQENDPERMKQKAITNMNIYRMAMGMPPIDATQGGMGSNMPMGNTPMEQPITNNPMIGTNPMSGFPSTQFRMGGSLTSPSMEQTERSKAEQELFMTGTKKKAEKQAEMDIKKKDLAGDLSTFWALDDELQKYRVSGLQRFAKGGKKWWEGVKQDSPLGYLVASHEAARKNVRVAIARRKDVGNLSQAEQEAAEQIIPDTYLDSPEVAQIKNAYMKQLVAIEDGDKDAVRKVIQGFMTSNAYKPTYDPKTQKLQRNTKTGEIRIIPIKDKK